MKKYIFYLILFLAVIAILSIGLIFFELSLKYWLWSIGALIFYIWNKNLILGIKWSKRPKQKLVPPAIPKVKEYEDYINKNYQRDPKLEKDGFLTLVKHCVDTKFQPQLINFIENLESSTKDDTETNLYRVIEFTYEKNISFILQFDWKDNIEFLQIELERSLKNNFNVTIELPKEEDYKSSTTVFIENVIEDFDKPLRRNGLQMGLIDTRSDEYIIIIHKVLDKEMIGNAVNKIGYEYLER